MGHDHLILAKIELEMAKMGKWQPGEARAMLSLANQLTKYTLVQLVMHEKKKTRSRPIVKAYKYTFISVWPFSAQMYLPLVLRCAR